MGMPPWFAACISIMTSLCFCWLLRTIPDRVIKCKNMPLFLSHTLHPTVATSNGMLPRSATPTQLYIGLYCPCQTSSSLKQTITLLQVAIVDLLLYMAWRTTQCAQVFNVPALCLMLLWVKSKVAIGYARSVHNILFVYYIFTNLCIECVTCVVFVLRELSFYFVYPAFGFNGIDSPV